MDSMDFKPHDLSRIHGVIPVMTQIQ